MIVSYSEKAYGEISTNYTTYYKTYNLNKIYYGTHLKRTTIFRHLVKKVNGQIITDIYHKPTVIQLQKPQPQKLYKIHPLLSSKLNTLNNKGEKPQKCLP